jgi:tripartite-type tricarboxylate transporter receptor subunit TctC
MVKNVAAIFSVLVMAGSLQSAQAAPFPEKAVKIIVPQAPGGASDAFARIVAQQLSLRWGQPVIVENRSGAGGNIGLDNVARAPKDGYTLLMSYEGTQSINVSLYKKLSYNPVADFAPVATLATVPFVIVVNPNLQAKNFSELTKLSQSGVRLTYGSAGNGTINHLLGEMVNMVAQTKLTHIPYKGAAPAMTDLLGGSIDVVFTSAPSVAQQLDSGKLKALAITSAKRSKRFPDLPTVAESGYPKFDVNPWFGLFAPAGTPNDVIHKINTDVNAVLKEPETVEKFTMQGAETLQTTPEQLQTMLKDDIVKWSAVVKKSGAQVD